MKYFLGMLFCLASFSSFAQKLAGFSLKTDKDYLDVPVSFPLQHTGYDGGSLHLELSAKDRKSVV